MRMRFENERLGWLLRVFGGRNNWAEIAYIQIAIRGPMLEVEFPSDWHEHARAWMRVGLGFITFAFSAPWRWTVPDEMQCSGPTYGFTFFGDSLHLHYGKCKGMRGDPIKIVQMPWGWRFIKHAILSEPQTHDYTYTLKSGEAQHRKATIKAQRHTYWRPWIPCYKVWQSIDIEFDGEVGERTGSWKGGCTGCSYTMLEGETPLTALRRMEAERKF